MSDVQYKMVNGELIPLTPEDIAQIESDRDSRLPEPVAVDAAALARLANNRIDRGIEVGYDAIKQIDDEIGARMRMRREITTEEIERQLAALSGAVRAMINAQRTYEPPVPPPVTPIAPVMTPASRKRGARK